MFMTWLKKPTSLLIGFYLMADLTLLSAKFKIEPNALLLESFDFYLFLKLLSPQPF